MNHRIHAVIAASFLMLFVTLIGLENHAVRAQVGGTPILLVHNPTAPNPFGAYLGEILRAEGLNSFDVKFLSEVNSAAVLTPYKVVILAETSLEPTEASYFTSYVSGDGYLIAMRPDADIKALFGLGNLNTPLTDGYIKMPGSGYSAGLSTATLQIHGDTDRYASYSGTEIADLYSSASTDTTLPAVISGTSGRAVAFLYDLAKSVVYTRQGNPANADVDTDGDGVLRTIDLFQTVGGGAPWVDLDKVPIPQADEQQRLFARLVKSAVEATYPMPQLWYFPSTDTGPAKTMLISTSDAHANLLDKYEAVIDAMNDYNGDITIYLSAGGDPLETHLPTWRSQGHEFGIHPSAPQPATYAGLQTGYTTINNYFTSTFPTIPRSRTVRNHQVTWVGWTDAAELAAGFGLAMDTNFYHWGPWLQKPDDSWPHGYVTGSGQPMKFIKADGTLLPYYQQLTQLVDEQFFAITGGGFEGLTIPQALTVSEELIDASLAGDYAAIMTQFHVDYTGFGEVNGWVTGTLDYAQDNGVPLWNADDWLTFTETRHDTNYSNLFWNAGTKTLSFSLTASNQPNLTLSIMLPLTFQGEPLLNNVRVDGIWVPYTIQTIKGINVAFVSIPAGNHNFVVRYGAPPPTPTAVPAAAPVRHWTTNLNVSLSWTAITWAKQYQVQVGTNSTFTPAVSILIDRLVSASDLSTNIVLPQEGIYFWRVRAEHPQYGWRPWSATQQFAVDIP